MEVKTAILNLKSECSPGWDTISSKLLQNVVDVVAPVITDIINRCFESGVFPKPLKKSIVIPIYKAGDTGCVNNYRPISILSSLSKVFERTLNNRLIKFLESNKILAETQYGFRARKSTDEAVHIFSDFVVRNIDENKKCLTIFLDLAKAFDTVSIPTLIRKITNMGIRGNELKLIADYLSDRTQRVRIGDHLSDELPIEHGVPQGSVLGPTLFLCYINELCQLNLKNCKIISYADDTTLTFKGNSWEEVYSLAQSGLNTVCHWLAANSLTLNADKTKYIPFAIRSAETFLQDKPPIFVHQCSFPPLNQCSCSTIQPTQSIRYLGVTIDKRLSFDEHIHNLCKRVRKLTYIFKQLRQVANGKTFKMVYSALVQSILTYCVSTWGGAGKTKMLEIERAQRLILKVGLSKPRLYPTEALYREAEVLTVRQIYILCTILRQHSDPSSFDLSKLTTRRQYAICGTIKSKTAFAQKFYTFRGPELYNRLNKELGIFNYNKSKCKLIVTNWLLKLNYTKTEELLVIIT